MTGVEEIIRKMRAGIPVVLTTARVSEVDDTAMTCRVVIPGKPDRPDVRLRAVITNDAGLTIIPSVGSDVLVALIDNRAESSVVLATSEVDSILFKTADSEWVLDNTGVDAQVGKTLFTAGSEGYVLKRENESLKGLLDELIDAISKITVPTGTGPSGTPVNAAVMLNIKKRLNTVFKG